MSFSLLTDVFVRFKKTKEEKNSLYDIPVALHIS